MQIPPHVKNNPNFTLLSEYFSPEEVVRIVESRIPLNRPGVVPSLQVPPGAKDCDQIPVTPVIDIDGMGYVRPGLGDWTEDIPLSVIGTPATSAGGFWQTISNYRDYSFEPQTTVIPQPQPPKPPTDEPDKALAWVSDNWLMIAGALGGLLALSMVTKK